MSSFQRRMPAFVRCHSPTIFPPQFYGGIRLNPGIECGSGSKQTAKYDQSLYNLWQSVTNKLRNLQSAQERIITNIEEVKIPHIIKNTLEKKLNNQEPDKTHCSEMAFLDINELCTKMKSGDKDFEVVDIRNSRNSSEKSLVRARLIENTASFVSSSYPWEFSP